MRGAVQGESYRFNINNFCKGSSLYRHGMQPLIYSAQAALGGVGWRRGGREVTYFENGVTRRDRDKGSHSTMSFVWTCEHASDLLYFAMCYPYTFSKLRRCGTPTRALSARPSEADMPHTHTLASPPAPP